jgi:hypothetical protein
MPLPSRALHHELDIISRTVSNTWTLVLPSGPLTKEKWTLELESHFNSGPRMFENNPWLHVFGELVEHGKFEEEQSENYSPVGNLEEGDVFKAIKGLKGPAHAGYLRERNA